MNDLRTACNVDLARRIIDHEWLYDAGQVAWAERILNEAGEDDERSHVEFLQSLKRALSDEFSVMRVRENPQLELFY